MSAAELPDDPRAWPDDPFAVLGVRRGDDDTTIRRAYTRLVRRFKPEHHPEQFRRVRSAYEACREQAAWYRDDDDVSSPPEPSPTTDRDPMADPITSPPPPSETAPAPLAQELPRPRPVDEVERLWSVAVQGQEAEAYAGLTDESRSRPDRADIPLRLYWLLTLSPGLDPVRTRHTWLADALTRSRLRGPAAELYRRELEANPNRGLADPYDALLQTPADPADVASVARWRINAAGRQRRFALTAAELRASRGRLADRPVDWLGLLVSAADWAAWWDPEPPSATYRTEWAEVQHLGLQEGWAFDRLDQDDEISRVGQVVRRFCRAPVELVDAVQAAWADRGASRAADVAAAAAAVAADPARNLGVFDALATVAGGPVFVRLATELFDRARWTAGAADEPEFPQDLLRGLAGRFDWWRRDGAYAEVRPDVLRLATEETVDPQELAGAWDEHPSRRARALARHVRSDASLRLVWLASRIELG